MSNLATKYRPKVLADVVGQPSIVRTISNAMAADNLHHAYLFVGQYGSGKTTIARILAAMENCTESPGLNPCGKCDVCKGIFAGTHTDVEEIDAASGAGKADEVRKLKLSAMYNPVDGCRTKIFILDECHRMSAEANDALLKVLEEPPPRVRFILCTTDPQKVRAAIVSRCQRHDFRQIYWTQIAERVQYVAKQEKIKIEEEAVSLCARMAKGSMRDGLNYLQKLLDYSGNGTITSQHAQEMFGKVGENLYYDLIDEVIGIQSTKIDSRAGFKVINRMLESGATFLSLYEGIADHLRQIFVAMTASGASEFIHVTPEGKARLKNQIVKCKERHKLNAIMVSLKSLNDARLAVSFNLSPEIALQQWFVESVVAFRS
jgi:DNA polymerase-3 subunit gamma/tau